MLSLMLLLCLFRLSFICGPCCPTAEASLSPLMSSWSSSLAIYFGRVCLDILACQSGLAILGWNIELRSHRFLCQNRVQGPSYLWRNVNLFLESYRSSMLGLGLHPRLFPHETSSDLVGFLWACCWFLPIYSTLWYKSNFIFLDERYPFLKAPIFSSIQ